MIRHGEASTFVMGVICEQRENWKDTQKEGAEYESREIKSRRGGGR